MDDKRDFRLRDSPDGSLRPIRLKPVWTFILLWPVGAFFAAAAGVTIVTSENEQLDPVRYNQVAEAHVTTYHYGRRSNSASYEFSAPDPVLGEERKYFGYDHEITDADRHRAEEGKPIKVAYSSSAPGDNRPLDHPMFSNVVFGAACFALCFFLIWHMWRDWQRYRILVAEGVNEEEWVSVFWEDLNEPPPPDPYGH